MRRNGKIFMTLAVSLLLAAYSAPITVAPYSVLIGANPEDMPGMPTYQTVVIDAEYFEKADIDKLHERGGKIYSYLNVGSVETFRDVYPKFKAMTLDPYDNWPGEFWIDVSRPEWQNYIMEAAGDLAAKGVDGFFIDNADVCYEYGEPKIFQGLVTIIKELDMYGKDIVINGGDTFVSKAILDAETPLVSITAVNQECVFTAIDFDGDKLTVQEAGTKDYYLEYLKQCKEAGITVYLTEYAPPDSEKVRSEIAKFCAENAYIYYISASVELDGK